MRFRFLYFPCLLKALCPPLMTCSMLQSQPSWFTCSGGTGNSCPHSLLNSCPESIWFPSGLWRLRMGPSTKSVSTRQFWYVSVFFCVSFSCAQTSPNCLFEIALVRLIEDFTMAEHTPVEIVRHASTLSIVWGVFLIVFGMLAVGSPFLAAVAVNVAIAWLIVLAGVVHVALAFHAHRTGRLIWKLLVGLAYLFFGASLIMHPVLGVASLTLLLVSIFLI